ncbi:hypothetical protein BH10ACI2_BH10ACI2_16840 [soil metagenome]
MDCEYFVNFTASVALVIGANLSDAVIKTQIVAKGKRIERLWTDNTIGFNTPAIKNDYGELY